jgi:cysteine desulfurase family protein (TIGR01976 family)
MLDVRAIRAQFPSLSMTLDDGRPCVFLDAPAGTQVPLRVADAISNYFYTANANSGGAFLTSKRSDAAVLEARRAMADFLGAPGPENIVFGANMTTLTFAVSRAIGRALQPGDEILCTGLDHDGNVSPWLALEEERGLRVRFVDIVPENGTLDLDDLERKLSSRTKIVAVTFASNALGTINDVAAITRLAHQAGALSWIDAVHYAPHGVIDVQALDCDFLVCSAYKFFGPHIGILYGKRSHLETFSPYKVRPAPDEIPDRWETGTPNNECLAGVHAAVEYVASLAPEHGMSRREQIVAAMNEIRAYERELSSRLIGGLLELDGMTVYGIVDPEQFAGRAPTVACRLEGYTPRQVAERLGAEGIFVWDGNYYALEVMTRLGLEESGGAVRIGPVHYNTPDEIDRTLDVLRDMVLRRPSRR